MKLRFFTHQDGEAFILNPETEEVAGLDAEVITDVKRPPAFYEQLWEVYALNPLADFLRQRGRSLEDFTEVDSYGKPLQETA